MRPRVLVTRPEPGASRTAARLEMAGFEAAVLPLTLLKALDAELPAGPFDAVIVTSAQALEHACLNLPPQLPVYAVGAATAASAERCGFAQIMTAGGSVASIAALVRTSAEPAARLLYLCGRVRRPELEAALDGAGFHVTAVETYVAVPSVYTDSELAARLGEASFDAVALMSAQAAEAFSALAECSRFGPLFTASEIVCFSERIAKVLFQDGVWKLNVTEEASEDALLDLLSQKFLRS